MSTDRIIRPPQDHAIVSANQERRLFSSRRQFIHRAALASIAAPTIISSPSAGSQRQGSMATSRTAKRSPKRPSRFAVGAFIQESNTFCPELSTLDRFKHHTLLSGDALIPHAGDSSTSFLGGIIKATKELGVQIYPTIAAEASPYGIVERKAYEQITADLYGRLESAPPLDGIVFSFHGAMVTETTMDPEGEILSEMRAIVGPDVPICCTFDFHCKVSQRMIDNADAFFYNNENPHVDSFDRGLEAARTCFRIAAGELHPVMVIRKPGIMVPTLNVRPPTSGPLVEVFKRVFEIERDHRVININIGPGFPWCDVPDAGMHVVPVVNKERRLAEDIAGELSDRLWRLRHDFIPTNLVPLEEAVSRAVAARKGPVVLVDVADNPGDGTTMDSNTILRELYRQNARGVAVACIRQPDVVQKCIERGVGSDVKLSIGCPYRVVGEPIEMIARVKSISDGSFTAVSPVYGPGSYSYGRSAVIEHNGIEIIVTERTGGLANNFPEAFWRNGINPSARKILVIKTFKMYSEPNYRSIASEMIEVDAPGQATPHLGGLEWKHIPRPMYPIDKV